VLSGMLPEKSISPGESLVFTVPYEPEELESGKENILEVAYSLRKPELWADAGHETAWAQFMLPGFEKKSGSAEPVSEVGLEESGYLARISGESFSTEINRMTGRIDSYVFNGRELIRTGPSPNFWRAPIDNDLGNKMPERLGIWKEAGNRWEVVDTTVSRIDANNISVEVKGRIRQVRSEFSLIYTISGTGEIRIDASLTPAETDTKLPDIPRIGLKMTMNRDFQRVSWYGRGPHETHWDRKSGGRFGIYAGSVDDQYVSYSQPQENGNKTDVRWALFSDGDGSGLLVKGSPEFSFSVRNYMDEDLDTARHDYELQKRDFVTLNLDHLQMGVGGDDSWGARTHPEFCIPAGEYSFSLVLKGVSEGE